MIPHETRTSGASKKPIYTGDARISIILLERHHARGPSPHLSHCFFLPCRLGVTIYDNAYEGYSGPVAHRRFDADYSSERKDDCRKQKECVTGVLIEEAEGVVIPGLSAMIEFIEAATPLINLRYTRNPQGTIYGCKQSMKNSYMDKLDNRSP